MSSQNSSKRDNERGLIAERCDESRYDDKKRRDINRTKTMQILVDYAGNEGEKAFKDKYQAYLKDQLLATGHRLVIKADKDGKLVRTVKRLT